MATPETSEDISDISTMLLRQARLLYQNLATELARALDTLSDGGDDPEAKGRADTIKAHRKALQTVLELELQFVKQSQPKEIGFDVDLDEAFTEVVGRFGRLQESQ